MSIIINGSMNRKEIASAYNISEKTLKARLKRVGLHFGSDRILLPDQIAQIVLKLGPWQVIIEEQPANN